MPAAATPLAVVTVNDPAANVTYKDFVEPINVAAAAFVGVGGGIKLDVVTLASVITLLAVADIVNVPVDLGNKVEKIPTSLPMS